MFGGEHSMFSSGKIERLEVLSDYAITTYP